MNGSGSSSRDGSRSVTDDSRSLIKDGSDSLPQASIKSSHDSSAPASQSTPSFKKPFDINALKAKMAEDKRKLEELKLQKQKEEESSKSSSTSVPQLTIIDIPSDIPKTTPSLSINMRYQQSEQEKRPKPAPTTSPISTAETVFKSDPSYDKRLKGLSTERKVRPLVFLKPGELTKKAEVQHDHLKRLLELKAKKQQEEAAQQLKQQQYLEQKKLKQQNLLPVRKKPVLQQTPLVEWWDEIYYKTAPTAHQSGRIKQEEESNQMIVDNVSETRSYEDSFDDLNGKLNENLISLMIEHPVLTLPPAEPEAPPPQPLMLTKAEQKKINKAKRRLIIEQRREETILGLRPAEKGRVRISNMMKVLGEAITDPTLVEKKVREEMAAREARHKARNEERKLTPEERKAKEKAKLIEDTSLSSHVAVFRVWNLSNSRNRFKVDIEANKNLLTGAVIFCSEFALVIVEGGPKAIARYKKFMLKRVPWKEPPPPPKTSNDPEEQKEIEKNANRVLGKDITPEENECHLVWQGEVANRSFAKFKFEATPNGARNFLERLGIAHYFDSARNYVAPQTCDIDE